MKWHTIYLARRSTDSQEQSLEYQIDEIVKRFQQFPPDEVVKITETGDDKDRILFQQQLIEPVEKKLAQGYRVRIIAFTVDRYSRNYYDLGIMHRLYKKGAVFLATDGKLEDDQDALLFGVQIAFANNWLSNMKKKQAAGILKASKEGRLVIGRPKQGYKDTKQLGIKELHPFQSQGIRMFFEDISTGKYSLSSYFPIAREIGQTHDLKIYSIEKLRLILREPFYAGYIVYQKEWYKSKSPAIVELSLWKQVQEVLNSRGVKHMPKTFAYNHLIKTPEGHLLCGQIKKGRYIYYQDVKRRYKPLKEEDISQDLSLYFKSYSIDQERFNEVMDQFESDTGTKLKDQREIASLELGRVDQEILQLRKLLRREVISEEDYKIDMADLTQRRAALVEKSQQNQGELFDAFMEFSNKMIELVKTMEVSQKTHNGTIKPPLLELVVSNCIWDGENLTIEPNPNYHALLNISLAVPYGRIIELINNLNLYQLQQDTKRLERLLSVV